MESGGEEQVIFFLGKLVTFILDSVVELGDSLFFELVLFFEFLVLLGEDLELVFDIGLFNILSVKDSVKFFELVFELP